MSFANTSGACAACGLPLHAAQWSKHLLMCCVEALTPFCCSCALAHGVSLRGDRVGWASHSHARWLMAKSRIVKESLKLVPVLRARPPAHLYTCWCCRPPPPPYPQPLPPCDLVCPPLPPPPCPCRPATCCACCDRHHAAHTPAGGQEQPPHSGGNLQGLCPRTAQGHRIRREAGWADREQQGRAHTAVIDREGVAGAVRRQ